MPVSTPPLRPANRPAAWKWLVCGMLLLATTVNYMDRQTLAQLAPRVMGDLDFDEEGYGYIESAFAVAFAFGSLVMGWLADRGSVRRLYATAVLVWSGAGFLAGFAQGFLGLLLCRFLLGLAESANWPCALKTTQRILPPAERAMGNGMLQSGASLGAVLTPLVVVALLWATGSWRLPFLVVGGVGVLWVVGWLLFVRPNDLAPLPPSAEARREGAGGLFVARRFAALVILVVSINATWHFFRVWLVLFLKSRGYDETEQAWFPTAYFIAADVGTLSAGFAALFLARRGVSVHRSRVWVFAGCAALTSLSVVAAQLPKGRPLEAVLLVIGFGALGLFPAYYSFSQELTERHQGKVTGSLGFACWIAMAALQAVVGRLIKQTGSYELAVTLAGLAPFVGLAALLLLWGKTPVAPAGDGPSLAGGDRTADERVRPAPAAAG
jgi:ACS family hexuronate transporter-like MFS transporter